VPLMVEKGGFSRWTFIEASDSLASASGGIVRAGPARVL